MILILQRAQGVGDVLQGILDGMSEVVHGIDAPLVALTVMMSILDAVNDGVAHIEVAALQIDLGAQGVLALRELAVLHALEQVERLLHGTVTPGRTGGGGSVAAVLLELLGGQLTNISQSLLDQLYSELIVLFKVVRAVQHLIPLKAQPADIFLNGVHELHIFLGGVGVVKAQVALAAKLFGSAEVDAQSLAVADVQIAVGLGRETGMDGLTFKLTAFGNIFNDKLFNKVGSLDLFRHWKSLLT